MIRTNLLVDLNEKEDPTHHVMQFVVSFKMVVFFMSNVHNIELIAGTSRLHYFPPG